MHPRFIVPLAFALSLTHAGCSTPSACPAGTTLKQNADGSGECVLTSVTAVMCDPKTTMVQGGMCVADPSKFPKCGPGTMLDQASNSCIPSGGSCGPTLPPCPPQPNKFALNGYITHLAGGKFADMTNDPNGVEVLVYDPLSFLANPTGTKPQAQMTFKTGAYCFDSLVDQSGMGLVAVAVTDAGGKPMNFVLAGVGAQNVKPGATFRADAFVVEKSLVAQWDAQAGLAAGKLEGDGAYVAIFVDKPAMMDDGAKPVAGVTLEMGGMDAPGAFYFKGDFMTIDKTAMASDGVTGAVVQDVMPANLTTYSGKGGMVNGMPAMWETVPGASTGGVVFVQKLHVK